PAPLGDVLHEAFFLRTMTDRREPPTAKGTVVAPDHLAAAAPSAAPTGGPRTRARLGSQVTIIAAANAAVAGLGFLGSVLLLPRTLPAGACGAQRVPGRWPGAAGGPRGQPLLGDDAAVPGPGGGAARRRHAHARSRVAPAAAVHRRRRRRDPAGRRAAAPGAR